MRTGDRVGPAPVRVDAHKAIDDPLEYRVWDCERITECLGEADRMRYPLLACHGCALAPKDLPAPPAPEPHHYCEACGGLLSEYDLALGKTKHGGSCKRRRSPNGRSDGWCECGRPDPSGNRYGCERCRELDKGGGPDPKRVVSAVVDGLMPVKDVAAEFGIHKSMVTKMLRDAGLRWSGLFELEER